MTVVWPSHVRSVEKNVTQLRKTTNQRAAKCLPDTLFGDNCQMRLSRTWGLRAPSASDPPTSTIVRLTRTATRFNIKAQGRAAHLGYRPPCSIPRTGFHIRAGVLWNRVRGTRRSADREPCVRCATLGFDVQHLRRWLSKRESNLVAPKPTHRCKAVAKGRVSASRRNHRVAQRPVNHRDKPGGAGSSKRLLVAFPQLRKHRVILER